MIVVAAGPETPAIRVTVGETSLDIVHVHPQAVRYQVRYRRTGATRWQWHPATTATETTVEGLRRTTAYDVQVRAYLPRRWRAWVPIELTTGATTTPPGGGPSTTTPATTTPATTSPDTTTATTTTAPTTTAPPTTVPGGSSVVTVTMNGGNNLAATTLTVRPTALDFDASHPNARRYQARVKLNGTTDWTWTSPSTSGTGNLDGLTPGAAHTFQVRIYVGGRWRGWNSTTFTTPSFSALSFGGLAMAVGAATAVAAVDP